MKLLDKTKHISLVRFFIKNKYKDFYYRWDLDCDDGDEIIYIYRYNNIFSPFNLFARKIAAISACYNCEQGFYVYDESYMDDIKKIAADYESKTNRNVNVSMCFYKVLD